MDISVVVPLYNEVESLPELTSWIGRVMAANSFSYEVILIDDGSTDGSWELVEQLCKNDVTLKGIKFRRNYGKSAGLYCGFAQAEGDAAGQTFACHIVCLIYIAFGGLPLVVIGHGVETDKRCDFFQKAFVSPYIVNGKYRI